jgi:hypothetical protein
MDLGDTIRRDLRFIPNARVGKAVKLARNDSTALPTNKDDDLTSEIDRLLSDDCIFSKPQVHSSSSSSSNTAFPSLSSVIGKGEKRN